VVPQCGEKKYNFGSDEKNPNGGAILRKTPDLQNWLELHLLQKAKR